jgi:hypothetical protein
MPSAKTTDTTKRQRRIERRCIAPVIEALHSGQISARSADIFLRLAPAEQQIELTRRLSEARQREECHRLAASAIKQYLDGRGAKRQVDLIELSKLIKNALDVTAS